MVKLLLDVWGVHIISCVCAACPPLQHMGDPVQPCVQAPCIGGGGLATHPIVTWHCISRSGVCVHWMDGELKLISNLKHMCLPDYSRIFSHTTHTCIHTQHTHTTHTAYTHNTHTQHTHAYTHNTHMHAHTTHTQHTHICVQHMHNTTHHFTNITKGKTSFQFVIKRLPTWKLAKEVAQIKSGIVHTSILEINDADLICKAWV